MISSFNFIIHLDLQLLVTCVKMVFSPLTALATLACDIDLLDCHIIAGSIEGLACSPV